MRWMQIMLVLGCVLMAVATQSATPTTGLFSEDTDTERYDCQVTLTPATTLSATAAVHLSLEAGEKTGALRVTISKTRLLIEPAVKTANTPAMSATLAVTPGAPYTLTLMRRENWLGIVHNDAFLFRGMVPRGKGSQASITADTGWTVGETRIQRLESVTFADNFMRSVGEDSIWVTQSGEWKLQSAWDEDPHIKSLNDINPDHGQNPFAWTGRSTAGSSALCTVGNPFWEDYTMTAAIRPAPDGAVGVMVNMPDVKNGLLIRWSAANDHGALGDCLSVCRYAQGRLTPLAQEKGGYVPGHWYQLAVVSTFDGIRVLVDGAVRVQVKDVTPLRGGVGLYAEGKTPAIFDDITVYGQSLHTDILNELHAAHVNDSFANDRMGRMQKWATTQADWGWPGISPRYRLHREEFWGDHRLTMTVYPMGRRNGQLWLVLNADGKDPNSGYRLVAQQTAEKDTPTYTLYRETKVLATKDGEALQSGLEYTFRLCRVGQTISFEIDDEVILKATDPTPLTGTHPAYRTDGSFNRVENALVLGKNALDYTFTDAAVDWLDGEGTWMPTVRWACSPGWSFIGGWSRGDTILWHKSRFTGDQSFETYFAPKMEYPREHDIYDTRYRDFGLTICGDGKDPRMGYAAILGAPDANGNTNRRTVLLRNGVEVGSAEIRVPSEGRESEGHRQWFSVELRKRGAIVEVWVLGEKAIIYTDPHPIAGGVPAIWSANNGIVIARSRLYFANPPQPWMGPLVTIDQPWYPEWVDIGTPLTLQFPATWSASGQPVHLAVTPRLTPDADKNAVSVDGMALTFTPKEMGEHWYQVQATDGVNTSPSFHLDAPVFNPALGRDDAHALVLYRFDEGTGNLVHDQGAKGPAANLRIPKGGQWLPAGRGLIVSGTVPLMTASSVDKLLTIKDTKACTMELWISTTSIYPADGSRTGGVVDRWTSSLITWETGTARRNFTVAHQGEIFTFCGQSTQPMDYDKPFQAPGFRTGLEHLVLTWDGATTRAYVNGKMTREWSIPWKTENWTAGLPLLIGNRSDGQRHYLGAFYLVAIHDRCFTPEQVLHNYQAGPAAK